MSLDPATRAAIDGFVMLKSASEGKPLRKRFRQLALTVWGATVLFVGVAAVGVFLNGTLPPMVAAVLLLFGASSVIAWSAERDARAFGGGIMAMVKPDTLEAIKRCALQDPVRVQVLPLASRGDGSWAPAASVRLREPGEGAPPTIELDLYAPRSKRGRPAKPKIGPGGEPVHLMMIRGYRHSFDGAVSAVFDVLLPRVVFAVRY